MRLSISFLILLLFSSQSAFAQKDDVLMKAMMIRDLGQYSQAVKICDEFLVAHPKSSEGYQTRGQIYLKWGSRSRALSDLNRAIELDPENGEAYGSRSLLYQEMGQIEKSRADSRKALSVGVDGLDSYLLRAKLLDFDRNYQEALVLLDKADKEYPGNHHVSYSRGLILGHMGQHVEAVKAYTTSISIQPSFHFPYVNRGNEYIALSRWDDAMKDFDAVVALNPRDALAYLGRAKVYVEKKRHPEALEQMNTAVRLDGSPEMLYWRALVFALNGDAKGARADAETILRVSKDPELRSSAQELLETFKGY